MTNTDSGLMALINQLPQELIEQIMQKNVGPRWRYEADSHLNSLKNPCPHKNSGTLKRQLAYVQKKIRGNSDRLIEIDDEKLEALPAIEFKKLLAEIYLPLSLITQAVFLLCITDLKIEATEKIENDFGNFLLPIAYPGVFPPYIKDRYLVEEIAAKEKLQIVILNKSKGFYSGQIVAMDSCKILVQHKPSKAYILYFWDLPPLKNGKFPALGDQVAITYLADYISVFKYGR